MLVDTESTSPSTTRSGRALAVVAVVALALRLTVCMLDYRQPDGGLDNGYIETAASMASGLGPLMPSTLAEHSDVVSYMRAREAAGGRVDPAHPFPADASKWLPATGHPLGYSLLLFILYQVGNYSGMIALIHLIQAAADTLACVLVYLFVRNLFGMRTALAAAWIYALLPAPIVLTLRLQPDSLSCMFAAAILAVATYIPARGLRYAVAAGLLVGLASQFRAEFMLWSAIVICVLGVSKVSALLKLRFAAAVLAGQFLALVPSMLWTQSATGQVLLSATQGGSSIYEALGEVPDNPWKITLQDEWVAADALRRGFASPWSPEANTYYRVKYLASIREHPGSFLKLVAIHRLPVALVPPFTSARYNSSFSLWDLRRKERLTRWGVFMKYPGLVLRNMWFLVLMAAIAFVLLLGMLAAIWIYRRDWRRMAWMVVPWISTVVALSIAKEIEPRNVSPVIVPQVAAAALVATWLWKGRKDRLAQATHG